MNVNGAFKAGTNELWPFFGAKGHIMSARKGVTLLETLVVFAIIGLLLALLFPAIQSVRRQALEMGCKNNLHQLNLAVAEFYKAYKRLPGPGTNGMVGGWTIDVLPFLEQKNLWDRVTPGNPISTAPDILLRRPGVLSCPTRSASDESIENVMDLSHYVLMPASNGETFNVFDAPLDVKVPWASGLEMSYDDVVSRTGPHHEGFYFARGFQNGIEFIIHGEFVR